MSCDTLQHKSLSELEFPYLPGKVHAMMGGAKIPVEIHHKAVLDAITCATQLDGLVVVEVGGKSTTHDVLMFGPNPRWTRNLKICGEARVIAEGKNLRQVTEEPL